ncbi:MAG: hypothetical protein HYX24_05190 [Candidatus Aenigmarchaeota archaeon]|nr:hypothetical protein [Candidatus Aenigmarchaeota archaeon]
MSSQTLQKYLQAELVIDADIAIHMGLQKHLSRCIGRSPWKAEIRVDRSNKKVVIYSIVSQKPDGEIEGKIPKGVIEKLTDHYMETHRNYPVRLTYLDNPIQQTDFQDVETLKSELKKARTENATLKQHLNTSRNEFKELGIEVEKQKKLIEKNIIIDKKRADDDFAVLYLEFLKQVQAPRIRELSSEYSNVAAEVDDNLKRLNELYGEAIDFPVIATIGEGKLEDFEAYRRIREQYGKLKEFSDTEKTLAKMGGKLDIRLSIELGQKKTKSIDEALKMIEELYRLCRDIYHAQQIFGKHEIVYVLDQGIVEGRLLQRLIMPIEYAAGGKGRERLDKDLIAHAESACPKYCKNYTSEPKQVEQDGLVAFEMSLKIDEKDVAKTMRQFAHSILTEQNKQLFYGLGISIRGQCIYGFEANYYIRRSLS